jgi:signal transduction histidine kinase
LSRIENKEYLKNEAIYLPDLVKNTIEEFEDRAELKQQKLTFDSKTKISNIEGNKELMQILLNNLVSNAIKYTPEKGEIAILIQQEKEELLLEVKDNGKGISKEGQVHIFDRFKKYGTQKESFGLGLALVKQIADYHKISITFESELKVGTVFRFSIPTK